MIPKYALKGISIALLLFLLFGCKESTVQPVFYGSIEGKVIEAREDSLILLIVNASVSTAPATTSLVTDLNGKFNYIDISTGSYTITVEKIGYVKKSVTVSVQEDETTIVTIQLEVSTPTAGPGKATNPFPENEAINQLRNLQLAWVAPVNETSSKMKFDVYFYDYNSPNPILLAEDIEDTSTSVSNLDYNKSYFWRVDSKLEDTLITQGDVWSFSVKELPDYRFFYSSNRNGNYDIFNSDSLELDIIQLTNNPFREWWPRLSPNRQYVAFASDESIDFHIYTMKRDGSDKLKVTTIPIAGFHNNGIGFCWSPDGGKLLYSHYNELYTVDDNGANLTLIATAPAERHFKECEYSTFGDKIVVLTIGEKIYDNEIYIMNSDGTNMTLFVDNVPGIIASPSWSIDGNSILFTRDVSGFESPTGRQLDARMFIKGISDSSSIDLSTNKPVGTNDTNPRFSPDGAYVVFENTTNDGFNQKDLWIVSIADEVRDKIIDNAETPDYK